MAWLNNHRRFWRITVLLALLVALIGPWAFDLVNVPSQYPCDAPFIRLEGDFCGLPLSGTAIAGLMIEVVPTIIIELLAGSLLLQDMIGELFFSLVTVLIFLPFISSLLLVREKASRQRQLARVVVWGLAAITSLVFAIASFSRSGWALWGLWLYIGITAGALLLEIAVSVMGNKPKQI